MLSPTGSVSTQTAKDTSLEYTIMYAVNPLQMSQVSMHALGNSDVSTSNSQSSGPYDMRPTQSRLRPIPQDLTITPVPGIKGGSILFSDRVQNLSTCCFLTNTLNTSPDDYPKKDQTVWTSQLSTDSHLLKANVTDMASSAISTHFWRSISRSTEEFPDHSTSAVPNVGAVPSRLKSTTTPFWTIATPTSVLQEPSLTVNLGLETVRASTGSLSHLDSRLTVGSSGVTSSASARPVHFDNYRSTQKGTPRLDDGYIGMETKTLPSAACDRTTCLSTDTYTRAIISAPSLPPILGIDSLSTQRGGVTTEKYLPTSVQRLSSTSTRIFFSHTLAGDLQRCVNQHPHPSRDEHKGPNKFSQLINLLNHIRSIESSSVDVSISLTPTTLPSTSGVGTTFSTKPQVYSACTVNTPSTVKDTGPKWSSDGSASSKSISHASIGALTGGVASGAILFLIIFLWAHQRKQSKVQSPDRPQSAQRLHPSDANNVPRESAYVSVYSRPQNAF